jgi:Ca2+-binding EF-hand superfamily protein
MLTALNLALALTLSGAAPQEPPAPREENRFIILNHGDGSGPMDKDGDGQVSREEFTAPVTNAFNSLDGDGNGRLSPDEMKAGRPDGGPFVIHREGPGALPDIRVFEGRPGGPGEHDVFTIRKPGAEGENHIVVRTLRDGPPHEGGTIQFRRMEDGRAMDRNNDGRVTRDEFIAPLADVFGDLDTNGDGVLDESERGHD